MSTNFFVHVVESPSARDLLYAQLEGRVLYQALCTSRIEADYAVAADHETFYEAIGRRLLDRIAKDNYTRWPILHISAHGSREGIGLTNANDFIEWAPLANYLRTVNKLMKGTLIVSMSSCHGWHAGFQALNAPDDPFYALVGPSSEIELSDLAIGFSTFYHVLSKTWDLQKAYAAMKIAAANESFQLIQPQELRRGFEQWQFQQQINAALVQWQNQGGVPSAPPPPPDSWG